VPTPDPLRFSRRTAVAGSAVAAAVVVAGCTGDGTPSARRIPGRTITPAPSPDVALAASVLAAEQRVLDLVEATVRRHPGQTGALASARAAHRAHVALLADAAPDHGSASPSPSVSPSSSPSVPVVAVPASPAAALRALGAREAALAASERAGAEKARSGAFARVLASMAAAAQQQAALLELRAKADS
jgi:hypothetical protein